MATNQSNAVAQLATMALEQGHIEVEMAEGDALRLRSKFYLLRRHMRVLHVVCPFDDLQVEIEGGKFRLRIRPEILAVRELQNEREETSGGPTDKVPGGNSPVAVR